MSNYEYLLSDINNIKGVGPKISKLFRKKNINTIFDLLWRLPFDSVDRSKIIKINELKIGQIQTVRVIVKKYIFPRKRNLPNKVLCMDETGTMECIFFNSYEGYIRKILPLDTKVTINGRINLYKNKYQITNPTYVSDNSNSIEKVDNKYSLTEGLNEKKYRQLINKILENLPNIDEWHNNEILKKFKNISWKNAVLELHNPKNINKKGPFLNRLVYDEIFASFLINSQIRTKIRKSKKTKKKFDSKSKDRIVKKLNFRLTKDQDRSIEEINNEWRWLRLH